MKVCVASARRTFVYRIRLEADDSRSSHWSDAAAARASLLAGDSYRVELPPVFQGLHPDLHALAIWLVLRRFVGVRLRLPFGVSRSFAERMRRDHGVRLAVDPGLLPRRAPAPGRPALIFSGGMDSTAASLIMPKGAPLVFMDRIPHRELPLHDALVDLVQQRALCALMRSRGREVHIVREDHEILCRPYPAYDSEMAVLAGLYLADSLGLSVLETGSTMGNIYLPGYHSGRLRSFRARPLSKDGSQDSDGLWAIVGLRSSSSIAGLSEAATTAMVHRSPFRGRTYSCWHPGEGSACMACDKCLRKVVLSGHILEGRELPAETVDRFLVRPHVAAIFRRRFFDFHNEWLYIFQRIKCRHPLVRELQRQARRGPDLSWMERWYPPAATEIDPAYRAEVVRNIARRVDPMSPQEARRLPRLSLPPLHPPRIAPPPAPPPPAIAGGPAGRGGA